MALFALRFCLSALGALLLSLLLALLVILQSPPTFQALQPLVMQPPPARHNALLPGLSTDAANASAQNSTLPLAPWRPSGIHCALVFVKLPKCASSTMGGIARRIASNHNSTFGFAAIRGAAGEEFYSGPLPKQCVVFATHYPTPARIPWLRTEARRNVTLFSLVRRPGPRFLSALFFKSAMSDKRPPKEGAVLRAIEKKYQGDLLTTWLGGHIKGCARGSGAAGSCVRAILESYDFIGLVERMHESLAVLKILLDLSFSDVLYVVRSKTSGGEGPGGKLISPALHTAVIEAKLEQKERGSADELLYEMVNASLDSTIAFLGKERVARELATLEHVLEAARSYCKGRVGGTSGEDDCYWRDNGCGVTCMDEFVSSASYQRLVQA